MSTYNIMMPDGATDYNVMLPDGGNTYNVLFPDPADTTPPSVPENLVLNTNEWNLVEISWDASTDDISGVKEYIVYRDAVEIARVAHPTVTYSDNTVAEETSYAYTVSAVDNEENESSQSSPLNVTTPAEPAPPPQLGDVIQSNVTVQNTPGNVSSSVSLPSPATAGNLLIWLAATDTANDTISLSGISGVSAQPTLADSSLSSVMAMKIAVGGEQTLNADWTVGGRSSFAVIEIAGSFTGTFDRYVTATSDGVPVASISTGVCPAPTQVTALGVATFNSENAGDIESSIDWTNDYAQILVVNNVTHPSSGAPGLSIARKVLTVSNTQESTASWTGQANEAQARMSIFIGS